jgi:protein OS-9
MTMTDTILFVKEAKTCAYVLVIHTPRLCGEPGFKSLHETSEESLIRCREIVHTMPDLQDDIPDADYPLKTPPRKTVPPPPSAVKGTAEHKEKPSSELLRKTLEAIMGGKGGKLKPGMVEIEELYDDKQVILGVLDEESMTDGQIEAINQLEDALRAAGYNVQGETERKGKRKGNKEPEAVPTVRDEL